MSTKRARFAESSASACGRLIHNCPGPPHCAHLWVSGRKSIHRRALAPLPVSSAPVQPERSGKFLKRYRRLPEASCSLNCSAGDCRGDSLLVLGGVVFAGKTEWRSCVTTAAVASVSTPRPTRTVRRSVTGSLLPASLSRPLAPFTCLHLMLFPGSIPGFSLLSGSVEPGASVSPVPLIAPWASPALPQFWGYPNPVYTSSPP